MTTSIELCELSVRFGDVIALDGLTATIRPGAITGLLGRNGAGKSTLLSVLAGHRRPTGGAARVDGDEPYEHPFLMSRTCLVREEHLDGAMRVEEVFEVARELRRTWDQAQADHLVARFDIPRDTKVGSLSLGKSSALVATVGLASQAPITCFDEPQLGMDPPTRYAFYDELLADYGRRPRTMVISTHLVDEAASLFENVLIVDHGHLVLHEPIDDLRARGSELTGPADAVDSLMANRAVLHERQLGRTKSVVSLERLDDDLLVAARRAGVEVGPLPLQELFVHLTSEEVIR